MNELSTVAKLEGMMRELISVNLDSAKKIDSIDDKVKAVEKRMNDFENNSEITHQQSTNIRHAVDRQVCKLLNIPVKKADRNVNDKLVSAKYSHIFHQRCYAEVARRGHLATPYASTKNVDFIQAIKDIEAWTPSNGIEGLKYEADENARVNRIAREEGYR